MLFIERKNGEITGAIDTNAPMTAAEGYTCIESTQEEYDAALSELQQRVAALMEAQDAMAN